MTETQSQNVIALVRDLMFSSKISATARAQGVPVMIVRDPAALADTPGDRLLVDLNLDGAIDAAAAWAAAAPGRHTLGFVSHIDTDTITRARTAGIHQVIARSRFTADLAAILTENRE